MINHKKLGMIIFANGEVKKEIELKKIIY